MLARRFEVKDKIAPRNGPLRRGSESLFSRQNRNFRSEQSSCRTFHLNVCNVEQTGVVLLDYLVWIMAGP
jgi:hypothetical protein